MLPVESPFKTYTGLDGKPLNNGYVYFGLPNQNPITDPATVYWDIAGTIPASQPLRTVNGYIMRAGTPANVYINQSYSELVRDSKKRQVFYARNSDDFSLSSIIANITNFAGNLGSTLIGYLQDAIGTVKRTLADRLSDVVSVKNFGAKGDGTTDDTVAIMAAMAHANLKKRAIYFPNGDYRYTQTINIPGGVRVYGESEGRTRLFYSGAGDAVYMGGPGNATIISYCFLDDLTIYCTARASTVNGVTLDNCCYFGINRVSIFGSGNPNSTVPSEQTLYGSGINASNNSIIGHLNKVTTRLWARGRYYWTRSTSESAWTAAIVDGGQGESSNNSLAFQIGDLAVGFGSGQGLTIRDICIQGNYAGGILNASGESVTMDGLYFEGNASYDIRIGGGAGNPISNRIINCVSNGPDIGPTVYGNLPYVYKIHVLNGSFTLILNNDLSITEDIKLIEVGIAAQDTTIENNRLNSLADPQERIRDDSTTTHTRNNFPEKPTFATGTIVRTLTADNAVITYNGCGFRPTEIEFYACISGAAEYSEGSAGIGLGLLQTGITSDSGGLKTPSSFPIRIIRGGAGNEQRAVVTAFNPDGFTLSWSKIGTLPGNDMVVTYIARR